MYKRLGALTFVTILGGIGGLAFAAGNSEPLHGTNPMGEGTGCPTCTQNKAATPDSGTPSPVIEGEVLKVDREYYMVKDLSGKEVKIQLDERTNVTGSPKVGDNIIAQMEPQGYAYSIKRATGSSMDSVAGHPDKRTGPPAASDIPGQPSSGDVLTQ
jgi:uncharacterized protein YdeI (BOF family)